MKNISCFCPVAPCSVAFKKTPLSRATAKCLLSSLTLWFVAALFPGSTPAQIVTFSQSTPYSYDETNGQANITLVLSSANATNTTTVDYMTTGGTAVPGVDYVSASNTVTFPAGTLDEPFGITLLNNSNQEGTVTVDLVLLNPTGGLSIGDPSTAVLNIVAVVLPKVQFSSPTYFITQTDTTAVVTLVRTGPSNGTVSVDFSTSDGSATAGIDYTATTGTVTFADGVVTGTINVPIIPSDALKTNQTVNLTLTNPVGGIILGNPSQAVLTILATSSPVVQFSSPDYKVHEHAGSAIVTAVRFGDTSGDATVGYATSDGTAISGTDYFGTSGILSFVSGDSSKSFSFQIVKYQTFQSNKTVNVALSNPSLGTGLGTQDTAVVTIVNDRKQTAVFTNSSDDTVTVTLQKAGMFEISNPEPLELSLSGTDATSLLAIKVKKAKGSSGLVEVDSITADGDCGVINAPNCDLVGPSGVQLDGYLGSLVLHDIAADVMASGVETQRTRIAAHAIEDGINIDVGSRINSLTAAQVGAISILAPSIGTLSVRGDKRHSLAGDYAAQMESLGIGRRNQSVHLGIAPRVGRNHQRRDPHRRRQRRFGHRLQDDGLVPVCELCKRRP